MQTVQSTIRMLETTEFKFEDWDQFTKNVSMRDRLRANDHKKFITLD
jgi:hypothetical protein